MNVRQLMKEYNRLNRVFDRVCIDRVGYDPALCNAINAALSVIGKALRAHGVR